MEQSDSQKSHEAWQSPPRFEDAEMIHSSSCSRARGEAARRGEGSAQLLIGQEKQRPQPEGRQGQKGPCPPPWEGTVGQLGVSRGPGLSCRCFVPWEVPHKQITRSRLAALRGGTQQRGGLPPRHLQHPQGTPPSSEQDLLGWERNSWPMRPAAT